MTIKQDRTEVVSPRTGLVDATGPRYWRSLDEIAATPEFQEFLHREFPGQASEWNDPAGRRRFLKLMSASFALAGFSACTLQPPEKIIPYVRQPEDLVLGRPQFFATAMSLGGVATGLLVESHEGRPTKIEGNPDHPASLGAADLFSQASVLALYDPDRSQTATRFGDITSWSAFLGALRAALEAQRGLQGAGIRLLSESVNSPTLEDQIRQVQAEFPGLKWHQYEPGRLNNQRIACVNATGQALLPYYHFDRADVIFSIDANFLQSHPANLHATRAFAQRRALREGATGMSRFYAVETCPTNTGAKADHRLAIRASEMEGLVRAVASAVGLQVSGGTSEHTSEHMEWVRALADDLASHRGTSLVIAGEEQSPIVHQLAFAINQVLDNIGRTVSFVEPPDPGPVDQIESLRELAADIEAGRVDLLVILGGNPVYTAPADLRLPELLPRVAFTAHLGMYNDDTSVLCQWHIPRTHYLESWGDARSLDGTVSMVQPLITPLYQGKSDYEVLAAFGKQPERTAHQIVREYWMREGGVGEGAAFERFWKKSLHDGFVSGSTRPPRQVQVKTDGFEPVMTPPAEGLEINFRLDPAVHDGRFANNGWLQELPRPITTLTWDNAALMSPATARRLNVSTEDVITIRKSNVELRAPVLVTPGHANESITLHLGFGRARVGRVGTGVGFNAYVMRTSDALWTAQGAEVTRTGGKHPLAMTQNHWVMEGRDLVRSATLQEYVQNPEYATERVHEPSANLSMFPEWEYDGYKWGMAIDLNSCVGCGACVVACQSENNIPVVGKEEVYKGREMHWLRVDRYYEGGPEAPRYHFMPVPCMHCENAPCELVCPVAATAHSAEGLNDMVYNRCVGTRYCANNCPYKVRRFNFVLYQDFETASLKMLRNPDVSVRSRGVMEKCTYCVQRINAAKIEAEKESRQVRDGEIVTACQATCPADAIVFGDLNDPASRAAKLKSEARNYSLLGELNTKPRTTYLAEVRNPNEGLDT